MNESINKTTIKSRTMRRVTSVYYLRKVLNRFTLKTGLLVLGAVAFGSVVHVSSVFGNMPAYTNISELFTFSYYAFMNTEIIVQTIILASAGTALWLARDISQKLFATFTTNVSSYTHA